MATPTRVYRVTDTTSKNIRLVRGPTKAAVRAFASRGAFDVEVATQNELIAMLQSGVPVEEIKAEEAEGSSD